MLKKTIRYTNPFTDKEEVEEHYFHISKADLVEMEMEEHGATYTKDGQTLTGMQAKLQRMIDSQDGKAIMAEFRSIIQRSYGRKEGDRFLKSKTIWEDFESSEAFSQLLFELCTSANAGAEFMNGVVPGNLEQVAAEVRAQAEAEAPSMVPAIAAMDKAAEELGAPTTSDIAAPRVLTTAEVVEMDALELKAGLSSGKYKLS